MELVDFFKFLLCSPPEVWVRWVETYHGITQQDPSGPTSVPTEFTRTTELEGGGINMMTIQEPALSMGADTTTVQSGPLSASMAGVVKAGDQAMGSLNLLTVGILILFKNCQFALWNCFKPLHHINPIFILQKLPWSSAQGVGKSRPIPVFEEMEQKAEVIAEEGEEEKATEVPAKQPAFQALESVQMYAGMGQRQAQRHRPCSSSSAVLPDQVHLLQHETLTQKSVRQCLHMHGLL